MSETAKPDDTNYGVVGDVPIGDAMAAVHEAAWDEGQSCPTCHGDGRVPGGRRVVHCQGGFTGADWDEQAVLDAIRSARRVAWIDDWTGHDLAVVTADGDIWRFGVKRPDGVLPRAGSSAL